MNRLIVVGSPRSNGRSAHLAEMLFEACIDECPQDELYLAPLSELSIAPCVACDACKKSGIAAAHAQLTQDESAEKGAKEARAEEGAEEEAAERTEEEAAERTEEEAEQEPIAYCPRYDDDMLQLYEVLCDADELVIVSPVFFSGAPATLTAFLDRLQPFFWEWLELRKSSAETNVGVLDKRPATLHIIGEGLDKNGYSSLVGKVRSALAVAGFQLEYVVDWVGKIDADGTIFQEAEEYRVPALGEPLISDEVYLIPLTKQNDASSAQLSHDSQKTADLQDVSSSAGHDIPQERPTLSFNTQSASSHRPRTSAHNAQKGKKRKNAQGSQRGGQSAGKGLRNTNTTFKGTKRSHQGKSSQRSNKGKSRG